MKLTKSTVTVNHGMYGKFDKPAYCKDGLALVKIEGRGTHWQVYHQATGAMIASKGIRRTQAEGKRVMAALLALPIQWASAEARVQVSDNRRAVEAALATA